MWSQEQIEQWRSIQNTYFADVAAVIRDSDVNQQRYLMQQEMVHLLASFLQGRLTLKDFNTQFQQQAYDARNVFCLRGTSGGMFLNKLIKYVPDQEALACQLRAVLGVPEETRDGQKRMRSFDQFLEELISQQKITRSQLQPSRVPFLLSACWHLQERKRWPICYPLIDTVITHLAGYSHAPKYPIGHYFEFRTRFNALVMKLGILSWDLEHMCTWYGQRNSFEVDIRTGAFHSASPDQIHMVSLQEFPRTITANARVVEDCMVTTSKQDLVLKQKRDASGHTHLQWLLAKIGLKVGCGVWIAANDHSKVWKRDRLGDLSVKSLPILADSEFHHIVSRIDVLWFQNNEVVAAFEIERTTEIYPGLLRLYDLGGLFPKQPMDLCIVAPKERLRKVQFELSRPSLHGHEMRSRCALICEEVLLQHEEHILRWASSPSIIKNLICDLFVDEK